MLEGFIARGEVSRGQYSPHAVLLTSRHPHRAVL